MSQEQLIEKITAEIISEMSGYKTSVTNENDFTDAVAKRIADKIKNGGKINEIPQEEKSDYSSYPLAKKGTDPKEVVIGVGPAFEAQIKKTINGLSHEEVLANIKAGIEEEGMVPRVVKVLETSDVCFLALAAAKISGSGISVGIQSKGTAVIHQKDLYPLSNLELFPQAPLMTLLTYRKIGQNAALYAKGEQVRPIEVENDPMIRAKYQVKAALMHIKETNQIDERRPIIEWNR